MSMPRIALGVLDGLVGGLGELHAAGLAAAAGLDLRLDDDTPPISSAAACGVLGVRRRPCRAVTGTSCLAKSSFAWYSIRSTVLTVLFRVALAAGHASAPGGSRLTLALWAGSRPPDGFRTLRHMPYPSPRAA